MLMRIIIIWIMVIVIVVTKVSIIIRKIIINLYLFGWMDFITLM